MGLDVYVLCVYLWIYIPPVCQGYTTLWDVIQNEFSLHEIARAIEDKKLTDLFLADNITVFLPSNEAYFSFRPSSYGYRNDDVDMWRSLLLYSSVPGSLLEENFHDEDILLTRLGLDTRVYMNKYSEDSKWFLTINGARFIESDIQTENGVLHIIDRMLAPIASNNSIAEYLEAPQVPSLSFTSIIRAKIVVPDLEAETRNNSLLFTSFSPNDSNLFHMPLYGKDLLFSDWEMLENVYRAHIVPYRVFFLPSRGPMANIQASVGTLSFTRYNGDMYVYNNMVRARVIHPNIPVGNGVLHVIDNLLFFVYDNILQRLGAMPETSKLAEIANRLPDDIKTYLSSTDEEFTVFAPTDWAFAKIPNSQQRELDRNDEEGANILKYLIEGHIIRGVKMDAALLSHDQMVKTLDNRTITIIHREGDTYLESGSVRARVEMVNIGCTNGVIHLISNVLFFKNFTIWEAIENIPELSMMYSFALQYGDIEQKLSSERSGMWTMFIASNSVLGSTSLSATNTLNAYPHMVHQALRGQIAVGMFSSSSVVGSVEVGTLAGKSLRIYREDTSTGTEDEAMMVEGSHVKARVIVKDIWCSNGVLHIVDDILHVAIRSVVEEMDRRPEISYTRNMFRAIPSLQDHLSQLSESFTVFIPHNDAYARLPWVSVNALLRNINKTRELMQAHIVTGVAKYIDEIEDRRMLVADKNVIYVIKRSGNVFVVNNNLWAKVIKSDIPASNGIIHIIDTLVYYPYKNVAEMLDSTDELRPFYNLMSSLPEFNSLVNKGERNLTVFAPSAGYLNSLAASRFKRIKNNTEVLRKLFSGHLLPYFRLDDEFLRRYPEKDYVSRSSLNTTFTLRRSGDDTYLDAGYEAAYIDLIGRGYGCSNGVIYVIDGFLNYSPFNLMERTQDVPNVEHSLGYLVRLINYTSAELLTREDRKFTMLVPLNSALRKLSYTDFATMDNFPQSERLKVFWRHILNDSELTYTDLRQGRVRYDVLPPDVKLETNQEGVFFKWRHVKSKVVASDRLASNGIIHVVDSFLFTTSDPSTTTTTTFVPPTTTTVLPVPALSSRVLYHPCLLVISLYVIYLLT